MGTALLLLGDFTGALDEYTFAADMDPDNADMHNNLGGINVRLQQLERALHCYDRALELNPDHPQAAKSRVTVARELGRGEEAIVEIEHRLAENPGSIETRLSMFHALVRMSREQEAVECITQGLVDFRSLTPVSPTAIKDNPEHIAQLNLRMALFQYFMSRHKLIKALAVINQCLALFDEPPPELALRRVGVLTELNQLSHAENQLGSLEERSDVQPELLSIAKAELLFKTGREREALTELETLDSKSVFSRRVLPLKGHILLSLGRMEECHDVLIDLSNYDVMAFAQLINTRKYVPDAKVLAKLRNIADNPLVPEAAKESVCYALAQALDKQKDYVQAFRYLDTANAIADRMVQYDPRTLSARVNATLAVFTPELFANCPKLPKSMPTPIFVVGMPRSGTTLTEQILGSHTRVAAAGELPSMTMISRAMSKQFKGIAPYPKGVWALDRNQLVQMARAYLRNIPDEFQKAEYIVDKMPHNFMLVGLIHMLFPHSPIIHVQRDPRDTALSNFQQNFSAKFGGLGYAFNLEKIALQINDYNRVMRHWRNLNIPMFEFRYEDLVNDQQAVSKQLLEYVGLDWDDGVMEFHQLKRSVRTASVAQVRQKIYTTSAQKWRRYESHLEPLTSHLDPTATRLWD